ncbi:hypothetical protein [Pseudanabaena sp. PCC 6802]|uniref:hypothetical protein n=1 Tax=Pseudanabaena sp. PCC 6802 TaxID=118173 RepID=UPI00034ACCF9|nr:hypothetical protein [Pseudanabaena sp. PCC 6802]
MNFWQKISVGVLFTIGFMFLTVTTASVLKPNQTEKDRSTALGGLLLGVPPTSAGIWMILDARRQARVKQKHSLLQVESTFLQMLKANAGSIATIDFALEAKLPLAEARQYLDRKARELNADFDVSENGGVKYRFPLS